MFFDYFNQIAWPQFSNIQTSLQRLNDIVFDFNPAALEQLHIISEALRPDIAEPLRGMRDAMRASSERGQPIVIPITIDGRKVAEIVGDIFGDEFRLANAGAR
jgi:hypothetical protein